MKTAAATDQGSSEQDYERLFENILLFARLLRRAGMTVGTGQILDLGTQHFILSFCSPF